MLGVISFFGLMLVCANICLVPARVLSSADACLDVKDFAIAAVMSKKRRAESSVVGLMSVFCEGVSDALFASYDCLDRTLLTNQAALSGIRTHSWLIYVVSTASSFNQNGRAGW